ncbi:MAG: hypothetical protein IT464_15205 [Planctomycetes bacterium]|nr:hypothetical protein [Planctomycetota bacterium]
MATVVVALLAAYWFESQPQDKAGSKGDQDAAGIRAVNGTPPNGVVNAPP